MERTTNNGREISNDGGVTWMLVEPSDAFREELASIEVPHIPSTSEERIVQLERIVADLLAILGGDS